MESIKRKGEEPVICVENGTGTPYLTFPCLKNLDGVVHGFSTRLGGVSQGNLSSMNLSFSRGDAPENVRENFRRMSESIGFQWEDTVFSAQTHTTNVVRVGKTDKGRGLSRPVGYEDVDGLITNEEGVVLTTFYADCVPLFFVDPVKRAIGLSHSGWRGTVAKMGKVTVEAMVREFGSDPSDLVAAVGPSICQDCYEVSQDVILSFQEHFPKDQWPSLFYQKENGKYQLNLWEANRLIFLEAGILPEHIQVTDVCTACNENVLFSHRASMGKRGNLAAFLELVPTHIRMAKPEDAAQLKEIYAPYVEKTAITFEYEPPSEEEFQRRIAETLKKFPYLVYEEDGRIVGYAYASSFHERAAFQWDAELSIYLREECRQKGVGRKLYTRLMDLLRKRGILKVYAHITYPNDASIAFHEAMGFTYTARFPKTGYKLGAWRDTVFMEKELKALPSVPEERW